MKLTAHTELQDYFLDCMTSLGVDISARNNNIKLKKNGSIAFTYEAVDFLLAKPNENQIEALMKNLTCPLILCLATGEYNARQRYKNLNKFMVFDSLEELTRVATGLHCCTLKGKGAVKVYLSESCFNVFPDCISFCQKYKGIIRIRNYHDEAQINPSNSLLGIVTKMAIDAGSFDYLKDEQNEHSAEVNTHRVYLYYPKMDKSSFKVGVSSLVEGRWEALKKDWGYPCFWNSVVSTPIGKDTAYKIEKTVLNLFREFKTDTKEGKDGRTEFLNAECYPEVKEWLEYKVGLTDFMTYKLTKYANCTTSNINENIT